MNLNNNMGPVEVMGGLHCRKDALTDMFGWFLQFLLAALAFTCLIAKRFCEPQIQRRSWKIWFYDTSKQGMGALVIHLANVWLSGQYTGDPCTWYIINFLLDSSLGLFIIFLGVRLSQKLSEKKGWEALNFGEYGVPPCATAWLIQCCLYVGLMVFIKCLITLLMQFRFWEGVRHFILSPINNPRVELAFVMLIIPFGVNILIFWVTDNFLMYKKHKTKQPSLIQRVKVKYKALRKYNRRLSEDDLLLSGDDDLLDLEDIVHRTPRSIMT